MTAGICWLGVDSVAAVSSDDVTIMTGASLPSKLWCATGAVPSGDVITSACVPAPGVMGCMAGAAEVCVLGWPRPSPLLSDVMGVGEQQSRALCSTAAANMVVLAS